MYIQSTNGGASGQTSVLSIYSNTNVGIGTSSATSYKLEVNGTLRASGAATFANTLTVTGAATLNSTLSVTGSTTLSSTLSVSGNTTINGTLTAGSTTLSSLSVTGTTSHAGSIILNNNVSLSSKDTGGTIRTLLAINTSNTLHLGYGTRQAGYKTHIQGSTIEFITNSQSGSGNVLSCTMNYNGLKVDTGKLDIGGARFEWDEENNAIKVTNPNNGPVNLYAMGGLSALGFSADISGVISQAMTIHNDLTVTGDTTIASNGDCSIGNRGMETSIYGNDVTITADESLTVKADLIMGSGKYIRSSKYYLANNVYLSYDSSGTQLQLHVGSTTYNLTKTAA